MELDWLLKLNRLHLERFLRAYRVEFDRDGDDDELHCLALSLSGSEHIELVMVELKQMFPDSDELLGCLLESTENHVTCDLIDQLVEMSGHSDSCDVQLAKLRVLGSGRVELSTETRAGCFLLACYQSLIDEEAAAVAAVVVHDCDISVPVDIKYLEVDRERRLCLYEEPLDFGYHEWQLSVINTATRTKVTPAATDMETAGVEHIHKGRIFAESSTYSYAVALESLFDRMFWGWGYGTMGSYGVTDGRGGGLGGHWNDELENAVLELIVAVNDDLETVVRSWQPMMSLVGGAAQETTKMVEIIRSDLGNLMRDRSAYAMGRLHQQLLQLLDLGGGNNGGGRSGSSGGLVGTMLGIPESFKRAAIAFIRAKIVASPVEPLREAIRVLGDTIPGYIDTLVKYSRSNPSVAFSANQEVASLRSLFLLLQNQLAAAAIDEDNSIIVAEAAAFSSSPPQDDDDIRTPAGAIATYNDDTEDNTQAAAVATSASTVINTTTDTTINATNTAPPPVASLTTSSSSATTASSNHISWEVVQTLHDLHPKPMDTLTSSQMTPNQYNQNIGGCYHHPQYTPSPILYLPNIPLDTFQIPGALDHLASSVFSERLVFDAISIGSMLGMAMHAGNVVVSAAMISSLLDAGFAYVVSSGKLMALLPSQRSMLPLRNLPGILREHSSSANGAYGSSKPQNGGSKQAAERDGRRILLGQHLELSAAAATATCTSSDAASSTASSAVKGAGPTAGLLDHTMKKTSNKKNKNGGVPNSGSSVPMPVQLTKRLRDMPRVLRNKASRPISLRLNSDFDLALSKLRSHHGDDCWIGSELEAVWRLMFRASPPQLLIFELWYGEDLIAADFAHPAMAGASVYVATRFFEKSVVTEGNETVDVRHLQPGFMLALCESKVLQDCGCYLWDLGTVDLCPLMQYKLDLTGEPWTRAEAMYLLQTAKKEITITRITELGHQESLSSATNATSGNTTPGETDTTTTTTTVIHHSSGRSRGGGGVCSLNQLHCDMNLVENVSVADMFGSLL